MNPLFTFFYWNQFHTKHIKDNDSSSHLLAEKIDMLETEMSRRIRDVIWA